jgi:RHS repeat-associated protein
MENFASPMNIVMLSVFVNSSDYNLYYDFDCNYAVNPGEKLVVTLDKTAEEIKADYTQNHYTITGPVAVTDQVAGSRLFYFGARFYDAELGAWTSKDAKRQYWNPYKYSANPNMFVDPDGNLFFSIINLVKSIQVSKQSGNFSDGLMNFTWNMLVGMNGTDPITTGTTFGGIEAVANIVSNYEGWANGNSGKGKFWQGAGKFVLSGISGWTTGQIGGLNASTGGLLSKPLGVLSAGVTSVNHDANFGSGSDYNITKDALQQLYSYGASGSIIKSGGDITWANHAAREGPMVFDSWYDESKNRYGMMSAKINGQEIGNKNFGKYGTGNNTSTPSNRVGHRFLGVLLPSKPWYYGFEAWGEPYEKWVNDDYDDDHWHYTKGGNPFGDSNAQQNGIIDFGSGWENAW